jgi:DNA ligase 1
MKTFAALLDRLAYEPRRNAKLTLIADYLRMTPDPERGYALAAMTGALTFKQAKSALIRTLIAERVDPVLFALSYDFVGDLSETVALLWPAPQAPSMGHNSPPPTLAGVVAALDTLPKAQIGVQIALWLDALDEAGRWALLKLVTGGLRIGVSARLAKTALASLGGIEPDAIEEVWHGLAAPYTSLFAWVEGRGPRPVTDDPVPFRPVMLAHALEEGELADLDAKAFVAEWKWDGIRVQAVSRRDPSGFVVSRLYSRTGEDVSPAFPDLIDALQGDFAIDGELLVLIEGQVQSFNMLQQRLNRKTASAKLVAQYPAHIRAYDLLAENGEDLRALPFQQRRLRLEGLIARQNSSRLDLSPLVPFDTWEDLIAARANPEANQPDTSPTARDAEAIEGVMLKRRDSPYLPGRPKGHWFKWKRDPRLIDAVLMYAQRGHGKRSSFYSDFTFGVWRDDTTLVPVGKAYFGFTDAELRQLDHFVRKHTQNRFGPVREVAHGPEQGLVLEIAYEGLQRSTRHKSGVAMRFPRINRIRWDKPAREADRLVTLEAQLPP